jgi:hypothetical protein
VPTATVGSGHTGCIREIRATRLGEPEIEDLDRAGGVGALNHDVVGFRSRWMIVAEYGS